MINGKHLHVVIIRVYEDMGRLDGDYRVLVDRLWPRGIRKDQVDYEQWIKDLAPSAELRKWYSHDLGRFKEFSQRYNDELAQIPSQSLIEELLTHADYERLVLLTATRDVEHCSAIVLKKAIEEIRPVTG